jgi:hypothetical protein
MHNSYPVGKFRFQAASHANPESVRLGFPPISPACEISRPPKQKTRRKDERGNQPNMLRSHFIKTKIVEPNLSSPL